MSPSRFGIVVLALLLAAGPVLAQESIESQVNTLRDSLKQARSANLQLIAPGAFTEASEHLSEAQQMMNEGDELSAIRASVQQGWKRLSKAKEFEDIGGVILEEAFTARSDALAARAPEFANELWKDAEETIRGAGEEIENGNQEDAREDAKEAVALYRDAELKAIRANLLGTARERREAARKVEAPDWASETWNEATTKLERADEILKNDRYNREASRTLAEEAANQFEHARRLAEAIIRIDDDVEENAESELLRYENHIHAIADTLGTDVTFGDGLGTVTERIVASIRSVQEDRENLRESLTDRRARIDRLQQVVDSLDAELAELQQREEKVSAQLQKKRERERTLNRVREVFAENEAEILSSGDKLIVRMQGLTFPSGSAEIQPANFQLLTKLQRVIREFSDGDIIISGHTDSRGNDARNTKLSEQRAQAVKEYVMANMDLSSDRIRAVGRGESQPVATNETEDGRSKNRRIDVSIEFR